MSLINEALKKAAEFKKSQTILVQTPQAPQPLKTPRPNHGPLVFLFSLTILVLFAVSVWLFLGKEKEIALRTQTQAKLSDISRMLSATQGRLVGLTRERADLKREFTEAKASFASERESYKSEIGVLQEKLDLLQDEYQSLQRQNILRAKKIKELSQNIVRS